MVFWQASLVMRLGPHEAVAALKEPNVLEFNITGGTMKGWVVVASKGVGSFQTGTN